MNDHVVDSNLLVLSIHNYICLNTEGGIKRDSVIDGKKIKGKWETCCVPPKILAAIRMKQTRKYSEGFEDSLRA